jgi:hypothetical protein
MRYLLSFGCWVLVAFCGFSIAGCVLERDMPPPTAGPLDSTIRASTGLSTGKVKFTGPVTFQIGGANNTVNATAMAKVKAPVATAPHAASTDASKKTSGLPWWLVGVLGLVASLAGIGWLAIRFRQIPLQCIKSTSVSE